MNLLPDELYSVLPYNSCKNLQVPLYCPVQITTSCRHGRSVQIVCYLPLPCQSLAARVDFRSRSLRVPCEISMNNAVDRDYPSLRKNAPLNEVFFIYFTAEDVLNLSL